MNSLSVEELRKCVVACGYGLSPVVDQSASILNNRLSESGISSRQELAMFLANILHESGGLRYRREINPHTTAYVKNGVDYYGRGFIQLTHHYNYSDASKALFGDDRLLRNPEPVADDLEIAWRTALWFWKDRVRRGHVSQLEAGDFDVTIRAINSMELSESATGNQREQAKKRRENYAKIRAVLGDGAVAAGSAPSPGAGGARASSKPSGKLVHTVAKGEYLSLIAQRYGTTWQQIAADNSITDPDSIFPGQRLSISKTKS